MYFTHFYPLYLFDQRVVATTASTNPFTLLLLLYARLFPLFSLTRAMMCFLESSALRFQHIYLLLFLLQICVNRIETEFLGGKTGRILDNAVLPVQSLFKSPISDLPFLRQCRLLVL